MAVSNALYQTDWGAVVVADAAPLATTVPPPNDSKAPAVVTTRSLTAPV